MSTDRRLQSLPVSLDSEKALLSSWLQSPDLIDDQMVQPGHFYHPAHRLIAQAMRDMRDRDFPVDMVTLTQHFMDLGQLQDAGDAHGLADIALFVPSPGNASYYAKIVIEKAARRRIIEVAQTLIRQAYDEEDVPADELLHLAEGALIELRNDTATEERLRPLKEGVSQAMDQIQASYSHKGRPVGLSTGLADLDRMTNGFMPGQMIVIAGRPATGKTVMALQFSREFSKQGPVAFFSMEMSQAQLGTRFIMAEARVDLQRMRDGFFNRDEIRKIGTTARELAGAKIFVDDTAELRILDFRSRARRAVVKLGCRAIFVDYLQLMKSTSKQALASRNLEVGEVSRAMKIVAKELNVPVIVLVQLGRDAEASNRQPRLSDLRESGQIEQDADIVGMLHRPHKDSDDEEQRRMVSLVLAKHRDGPPGQVDMIFHGAQSRFEGVTTKSYSNNKNERQKNYE